MRVPPITISYKQSFVVVRRIKSANSMCALFVLLLNVAFGRIERIGRLVVAPIVVVPFVADCGNPIVSSPHSDCTEQHTNCIVPPATALTVSRNRPLAESKYPTLALLSAAHVFLISKRIGRLKD